MKRKNIIRLIIFLLTFLAIFLISGKSNGATDFYYPSETEINYAIDCVKQEYPAGSKFEGKFDNGIQCIGFAKYAFNRIWGAECLDAYTSSNKYRFSLSSTSVVDEVGSLTGSALTVDNIRNLFYNTPKGSIIQTCANGQQHTMLFVSCDANSINVLQANVDYNLTVAHSTISYSSLASRYTGSGNGISTYKYNGKKNTYAQTGYQYYRIKSNIGGRYVTVSGTDVVIKAKDDSYDQIWELVRNTDTSSADYGSI